MIAWVIAAGRWVVETFFPSSLLEQYPAFFSVVKLKAGPFFMSTVLSPIMLGKCVEWVQRAPLRVSQIFVLIITPILFVGPQIVTPDTPFFFAWTLCLLMSIRMQKRRYHSEEVDALTPPLWGLAILLGLAMAFAAYSKYTAILIAVLVMFSGAGLWNSMIIALVCAAALSPYFYWLATDGLANNAGIFFQFSNGLGTYLKPNNFKFMGDLWASQMVFWTPLVFFGSLIFLFTDVRRFFRSDKRHRLSGTLFLWAFTPLFLFSITALKRPAEANWPLVGAIAATVMCMARLRNRVFSLWILALQNIAIVFFAWVFLTQGSRLAPLIEDHYPKVAEKLKQPSRLKEFEGWPRLHTLLSDAVLNEESPIQVESFQVLSSLLFVNSSQNKNESLNLYFWDEGSRRSEFSLNPKYLLSKVERSKPHWLLARNQKTVPGCRLYQGLIKGASEVYFLYTCNGLRP